MGGNTDDGHGAPIQGSGRENTDHFRLVAHNAAGTLACADHALTTLATSPNVAKILYGVAGDPAPHARDYTDATNAFGGTATTATGDVALQMVVRPSPATGEWVAAYADANGLLHVLCFDGIVWHNEWTATIGGTGTTRRFDVAYETSSGDAMVLYSGNVVLTNELRYRTKPGTSACGAASWSSETLLDPVRTSGTIEWVKLAWDRRASSNLLTAIWADDNSDLSAMLWSGTAWGDEPATPLETNLEVVNGAQDVEDFDTKFESLSGDVMVVWGTNVAGDVNGVRYATCTGGTASCTWSGVIVAPGFADDATHLDLSANPSTDEMVFASIGKRRSDLQAGYWSGSAWTATPNLDTTAHTPTARTRFVATGWLTAGAVTRSVVVYYDASANNVGWVLGNAGTFTVQTDFVPTPTFGTQKQYDIQMDPFGANHLMLTVGDGNSDLFAKRLVLNTNGTGTWTNADGGAALETHLASTIYKTFAFAYGR